MNMQDLYESRGASHSKSDVHRAIHSLDKGIEPSAFCKIMQDPVYQDYGIILHADGAGTKSALAYAYWRETADLEVWKGIAHDALIMNIDDMFCAGATNHFVVSSTIGRNKFRIPQEVITALIEGTQETINLLGEYGIQCVFAGGETADVGDLVRTVIVDATVFARIKVSDIIANRRIQPGDVIVGLSSFGQAVYERTYNSGIGSNGLTMARHELFHSAVGQKYPETYDDCIPEGLRYRGFYALTDPSPVDGLDMGRFVLSPTRTYAPVLKEVFQHFRSDIHGVIHCTGGGQTKVLRFLQNVRVVKNNLFPVPDIFQMIQRCSAADDRQMFSVFNMGHRMELYVPDHVADDIISISRKFAVEAQVIGYCESSKRSELIIQHCGQEYIWQL